LATPERRLTFRGRRQTGLLRRVGPRDTPVRQIDHGESKSRRGNHRLKNAMFLAAFAWLRSPDSKALYDRKRAEGKRHNAALICLARRRCNVILAMLRTNEHYRSATPMPELSDAA
jgi:transposase